MLCLRPLGIRKAYVEQLLFVHNLQKVRIIVKLSLDLRLIFLC